MSEIFGWFNYEKIFDRAVNIANQKSNFLEIGCFLGKSTKYLCDKIKSSNKEIDLYVIDLFVAQEIECQNIELKAGTDTLNIFKKNLTGFDINITKGDSNIVFSKFKDEYFDFIFIDGNHEYEYVKSDLKNFYPKLKSGGIFAGHDYTEDCGVPIAVNEFATQNKKNIEIIDTSWLCIK
jgi:predicted O-methyltransferase YrrM